MTIIIHRGTHQIGGCITEIKTCSTRIIIDMGAELPKNDIAVLPETVMIPGITEGEAECDAVFFTHNHDDHIGLINSIIPSIPLYIGKTAKEVYIALCHRIKSDAETAIKNAFTYKPGESVQIGDIVVTPYLIDHSAFDAYMFLIEADGKRILYTGDFRIHGFRGSKTYKMLEYYVGQVDWLVCEGTTLSRGASIPMSEHQLQETAHQIMLENKYVFVLCSSTNIDRIAAFYHAIPDKRPMICDAYQQKLLEVISNRHRMKSHLYDFKYVYSYDRNLDKLINERGFCMMIRANQWSRKFIDKYVDDSIIIYSMWEGYLDGRSMNKNLVDFLKGHEYKKLHTSGHASVNDLVQVYHTVKPRFGLIPIHSEAPEAFTKILPEDKVVILNDGEVFAL